MRRVGREKAISGTELEEPKWDPLKREGRGKGGGGSEKKRTLKREQEFPRWEA